MKKILFLISVASLIILISLFFYINKDEKVVKNKTDQAVEIDDSNEVVAEKAEDSEIKRDEIKNTDKIKLVEDEKSDPRKELPKSTKINVPFTSQSPYAKWDERHEEACEEASLLMVAKYIEKKGLGVEVAEKELQKMIDFQIEEYGEYKDSNMEELVRLAKDFYEIDNLKVVYDFKKEDIKKELSKNNPIIVPTAGRLLGNPYFTPPGPLYHNLVLVGYEGDNIITNDPGTKRGEGYIYDINILYNAIHDFTGNKEDIEKGRKAMIVIE